MKGSLFRSRIIQLVLLIIFYWTKANAYDNSLRKIRCINRQAKLFSVGKTEKIDDYERKKHVNKYSNFSKKKIDPLEEAIINSNIKCEEKQLEKIAPNRGTTVPTIYGSSNITKTFNITYNNINSIVPSDPFTFGFTKIGLIIGPHGEDLL